MSAIDALISKTPTASPTPEKSIGGGTSAIDKLISGNTSQTPSVSQALAQTPVPIAKDYFEGTKENFAHILDPIIGSPTKPSDTWQKIKDTFSGAWEAAKQASNLVDTAKTEKKGIAAKIGAGFQMIGATGGLLFSPISALFKAAEDVPGSGTLARIIGQVFTTGGESAQFAGEKLIDQLPIKNQEDKEVLKKGVGDIFNLASQIALGKLGDVALGGKKIELTKKYGQEDANVIMEKAQEIALKSKEEKSQPTPEDLSKLAEQVKAQSQKLPESQGDKVIEGKGEVRITQKPKEETKPTGKTDEFSGAPIHEVPISSITRSERGVVKQGTIDEVVKDGKVKRPIELKRESDGTITLVNGENRIKASEILKKDTIPGVFEEETLPLGPKTEVKEVPNTRSEKLLKAAVEKKLIDSYEGEVTTHVREKAAQWTSDAFDYIEKNPDKYIDVATGKIPHENAEAIYTAAEIKAIREGDVATIKELAKSTVPTEAGRGLKKLDSSDPNSPVKIVRDIMKAREEGAKKTLPKSKSPAKARAEIVKKGKAEVKTTRMKIADAQALLDKLVC